MCGIDPGWWYSPRHIKRLDERDPMSFAEDNARTLREQTSIADERLHVILHKGAICIETWINELSV